MCYRRSCSGSWRNVTGCGLNARWGTLVPVFKRFAATWFNHLIQLNITQHLFIISNKPFLFFPVCRIAEGGRTEGQTAAAAQTQAWRRPKKAGVFTRLKRGSDELQWVQNVLSSSVTCVKIFDQTLILSSLFEMPSTVLFFSFNQQINAANFLWCRRTNLKHKCNLTLPPLIKKTSHFYDLIFRIQQLCINVCKFKCLTVCLFGRVTCKESWSIRTACR